MYSLSLCGLVEPLQGLRQSKTRMRRDAADVTSACYPGQPHFLPLPPDCCLHTVRYTTLQYSSVQQVSLNPSPPHPILPPSRPMFDVRSTNQTHATRDAASFAFLIPSCQPAASSHAGQGSPELLRLRQPRSSAAPSEAFSLSVLWTAFEETFSKHGPFVPGYSLVTSAGHLWSMF